MSSTATETVLAVITGTLKPGQSVKIPTLNGTAMTLVLNNLNSSNNCGWSVSGFPLNPSSGTLNPLQQQVFPPTNFGGSPLTITNTTNPSVPANLQYVLT